jgi:hypothetical protein
MIPGFPPGMGGPSANLQQMLALSGGGPGLHPAVSSSAISLMNPGGGPPPDTGRQSELQHRASALSSNPGSSLYLDHDRRHSISPSSPPDVKENDVSGRQGNAGDRDRNSRGGGGERRNRSPDDSSDESSHLANARSNENHRGAINKKPRPNEKLNNSHGDDTDNDSDAGDGDLVVDVSNDEDSRSPVPPRPHQQNGEVHKTEPEREMDSNHHTKKIPRATAFSQEWPLIGIQLNVV